MEGEMKMNEDYYKNMWKFIIENLEKVIKTSNDITNEERGEFEIILNFLNIMEKKYMEDEK
jgi:Mn-containing catalase